MNFAKALVPGTIFAFAVAGVMGSGGTKGAWLTITHQYLQGHGFYWSWPLFIIGTGLSWLLFSITPK